MFLIGENRICNFGLGVCATLIRLINGIHVRLALGFWSLGGWKEFTFSGWDGCMECPEDMNMPGKIIKRDHEKQMDSV